MSYECPRCGTTLVETDDEVNDYELEAVQVRHTVKRCAALEAEAAALVSENMENSMLGPVGKR